MSATRPKRRNQKDHDSLVASAASNLNADRDFSNVMADLPSMKKPAEITWKETGKGHIPDLTADRASDRKVHIFEAETDDSIDHEHTADQWRLFSANAAQHDKVFWVVVATGSKTKAVKRLEELGIQNGNVWEIQASS